jgi:hypothetical protein
MLDSYNILNNGKCPFCQSKVIKDNNESFSGNYDHCFCINKCIKVMRIRNEMNWVMFRIWMNCPTIRSIEVDSRDPENGIKCRIRLGSQDGFNIPHFDIFSYSLDELRNKIKKYLIFS